MTCLFQPKCKYNNTSKLKHDLTLDATQINENKIIAFANKRQTNAESRYVNIERELLALIFSCERFHTYVHGKNSESDLTIKL